MNKEEFVKKWGHLFDLVKEFKDESSNRDDDIIILMLRDAISVIENNN